MTREASPTPSPDRDAGPALKLAQKAKQEALISMAMGIAHDFNNHLTAILGNNSLVLRHLEAQSPARKNVAQIEASALQALELSNQIQMFTGRVRPNLAALDLSATVLDMEPELRRLLSKGVELATRTEPDLPLVKADLQQIRRALTNLVMNSCDALADLTGNVVVATGVMSFDKAAIGQCAGADKMKEGQHVFIAVTDTGRGMAPDVRHRIFDPFFSTKIRGKGLGLAVTLGIARAHGGGILVESEPGKGSTFRLFLPAM